MPRAKVVPLGESNANATPKEPATKEPVTKANKSRGKKRAHEDDNADNTNTQSAREPSPVSRADLQHEAEDGAPLKWDCNQIRTRIRALINSGEMKVGEFQKLIDVSSASYQAFMSTSGPDGGAGSVTYSNAHHYFITREGKGLKAPRAKKAKTDDKKSDSGSTSTSNKKKAADDASKFDVSDITLPKEESGTVPIFDTCDDIRTKINAHLRKPNQTMASLGRTLTANNADNGTVTSAQIRNFIQKKGPTAGADSGAYYGAYVYFEKLRVKTGKPKSKKREEMEKAHGAKGAGRIDGSKGMLTCKNDERPVEDNLGRMTFQRIR